MRILFCAVVSILSPLLWGQGARFSELQGEFEAAKTRTGDAVVATEQFLPRFQEAARQSRDGASAAPFLRWIVENAALHHEAAADALERLLHGAPERDLAAVAQRLPFLYAVLGPDVVGDALDRLADSEDLGVRANALYSRALLLTTEWGRSSVEALRERSGRDMEWVSDNAENAALRARAEAMEFGPRSLSVGEKAPEILGLDMEGVPFKLSDYRGKVVVLDYWGDW